MAYDEALAGRIREQVRGRKGLSEMRMFGGLAFLINGNMAIAAASAGGALVRVDPDQSDSLVSTTKATVMEMRGREMPGWLRVDARHLGTDNELAAWVKRGVEYASSLAPKKK
jgi:TfoX/Sxy family transcriptional regulator of competence genes